MAQLVDARQSLAEQDPEVFAAVRSEEHRQRFKLEMIASENYTSQAVLEAVGTVLTNKYAEGYPGARYYGGCEFVDIVENLARDRAKQLFGAEYANVQPHAGAQANMAAYFAVLEPGDTAMGLNLAQGGHLSHGLPVNFSGRLYNFVPYGVDRESEQIDFAALAQTARECRPKLIVAGATAYPRTLDFDQFRAVADDVGARLMVDMAHISGLVAAGVHPSPVPMSDIVTSTTHKTLRGPRSAFILCKAELGKAIDRAVFPGLQGGPLMHVVAGKAVAFGEAMRPAFRDYQLAVLQNARTLAADLQAGGVRIVSGGTDTHLLLCDLTGLGMSGKKAERLLDEAGITVNKNTIPYDQRPPTIASGIRVGTPALTTRGMGVAEMRRIAGWMLEVLQSGGEATVTQRVRGDVEELCARFPVPGIAA
ncbi:MAG TPA: serine hydroxymethyltransferase [Dehalococcoidia bacterium]|nr:serine hydroxymethyltransferase [Dehalococcoidia bacterium]